MWKLWGYDDLMEDSSKYNQELEIYCCSEK